MKSVRLCLIVCLALIAASCSLKTNWDLVGKWQKVDGKEIIEFTRDGMITLTKDGLSLNCIYRFTDPKHMEIQFGDLGKFVMKVTVSGGTLTMTDAEGIVTTYGKMKANYKAAAPQATGTHEAAAGKPVPEKTGGHEPPSHQAPAHK